MSIKCNNEMTRIVKEQLACDPSDFRALYILQLISDIEAENARLRDALMIVRIPMMDIVETSKRWPVLWETHDIRGYVTAVAVIDAALDGKP
jgi:hypothetical protein